MELINLNKKKFNSKINVLVLLYFILFASINSNLHIKFNTTPVEVDSEVTFEWSGANEKDYNARIVFVDHNIYPTSTNLHLQNSFAFLNPESFDKKSYTKRSGAIKIKAPSTEGLFNIFYCAQNDVHNYSCEIGKPILVLICPNKFNLKEDTKKKNSKIEHIIIIIQENHSFDSIYGNYCKAEPFSNP